MCMYNDMIIGCRLLVNYYGNVKNLYVYERWRSNIEID